jgi:integrase
VLSVVLTADEVGRVLAAVENITSRVALECVYATGAYATGLRTSEVVAIRIEHNETARVDPGRRRQGRKGS